VTSVLVGVDASAASRRAVEFAAQRALMLHNDLVIAHVIPWSPFSFNTPTENEERHVRKAQELRAATEQIVDPLVETARQAGVEAKGVVRHGQPAETLLEILKAEQGIHIVVGRTGDSVLKQTIFGSIANRLAQAAPVPVTVVP
jgi:nucleotide-binding universal stress UspA family protein